jgi:transposase InsO family protein
MALGELVVAAVLLEGRPKAEVARSYGVSRRWVHELCRRFAMHGHAGLRPGSRRPHRCPHQTSPDVEDAIVGLRKLLADQGLDAGAHTIAFHLGNVVERVPSVSTIWRILQRRGFVTPQPQKRPKSSYIRFCAEQPNERWQADITHWTLDDDTAIEILNIVDDHSRLAVSCTATTTFKAHDVVADFHAAFAAHGLPASVLTDNAAVFTAAYRGASRCTLELELAQLGISHRHSRPYHPQTCGKVERFHQTLKKWLDKQPRAATLADLQAQLDAFRAYYNDKRPHRALQRRTPIQAYRSRPKAGALSDGSLVTPHLRVRRDVVDTTGVITLRHNSRLHHIGIGRAHRNKRVLVLVADLHIRVVSVDGELLRELVLDPTRDYQRQGGG